MMTEQDVRALVRREIRDQLTPIMMGFIVSNESEARATIKRMSIEGPIANNRSIQPFGVSSRAPNGTECLIIPVANDPTHTNMVGHFDKNKPAVGDGETCLYDANENKVHLMQGKINAITDKLNVISSHINLGSEGSSEPLVLGNIFKSMMSDLIELIATHQHYGNLGFPTSPPTNSGAFETLKSSPINDGAILSDKAFTEK